MTGLFNRIKFQTMFGALLTTSVLTFSISASANPTLTEAKSSATRQLESQISLYKFERASNLKHINKDLIPQFDKGGPDWQPIDSMIMHELDNEIVDYNSLRDTGHGSQLGEMQDQLVEVLAESGSFDGVRENVLAALVQNLTAKNAINPSERKIYLNKMRFQLGVSESKHLSGLLEELQGTRMRVVGLDRKLKVLNQKLIEQLKLESEAKN